MGALVVLQAVAIGLLATLVAGLLRSHAEILRSLHRLGAGIGEAGHGVRATQAGHGVRATQAGHGVRATQAGHAGEQPVALSPGGRPRRSGDAGRPWRSGHAGRPWRSGDAGGAGTRAAAVDLAGTTPAGDEVTVRVAAAGHDTLLAFLSSGCFTCGEFWRAFARPARSLDLPERTRLVIVTKDPSEESLSRLRELAPPAHPVVMSSTAWQDYGVPVSPYFVHVDGPSGVVVGQGAGNTWAQVTGLLRDATGSGVAPGNARPSLAEAEADVDRKLLAAGIFPEDPSLYPSRPGGE